VAGIDVTRVGSDKAEQDVILTYGLVDATTVAGDGHGNPLAICWGRLRAHDNDHDFHP
jgi:hypothetical protein